LKASCGHVNIRFVQVAYKSILESRRKFENKVITRVKITVYKQFHKKVRRFELRSIAKTAVRIGWNNLRSPTRVSIVIADDPTIKHLNTTFRNIPEVTDVLAFPNFKLLGSKPVPLDDFPNVPNNSVDLGEIIISHPQAIRQLEKSGNTSNSELALLTAHGILHLLGYDHNSVDNKNHMWLLQNEVLQSNGIDFNEP
jgi:probable rRNA maturation factor